MDYSEIKCEKLCIKDCRFMLRKQGAKPLIVLGLNPSTADEIQSDATIRKIMGFISKWQISNTRYYDCFIMLNLYPLIETHPQNLKRNPMNKHYHEKNLKIIHSILEDNPYGDILMCYGNTIELVKWLKDCRDEIFKLFEDYPNIKLYQLGDLTCRQHPRHPSRLSYNTELKTFIIPKKG